MTPPLRPPALGACTLRLSIALAAVFTATPLATQGCAGLTTGSSGDGGADARMLVIPDAPSRADSGADAGRDAGAVHDATLAPACLEVAKCCPQIPQVQLPNCMLAVNMNSSQYCEDSIEDYQGEIPDAGCDGSPTGTPGCETLASCCSSAVPNVQQCYELVDAGNESACVNEYLSLYNNLRCFSGPGP